jgi:hypothetical protein
MKNISFVRFFITALVLVGAVSLSTTDSPAIQEPFTADYEILDQIPIIMTEQQGLDFGQIIPPETGVQSFTVTAAGVGSPKQGAQGPDQGFIVGGEQEGIITVTGDPAEGFSVGDLAVPNSCSDPTNVSLTSVSKAVVGAVFPLTISVGGTLNVKAGTLPQTGTCDYTIEVNYT